jgi:cytochrome c biogenesis protein CcmG, thiol:disulfide interchange protein DsbE
MGALTLGPFVLSLDRAYAGLGFLVLIVIAELVARRGRPEVAAWAWRTALTTFVGARLAFVAANLDVYLAAPLTIPAVWQGGFAPWGGIAAGLAWTVWEARRAPAVRRAAPAIATAAVLAWWLPAGLLTPSGAADVRLPEVWLEDLDGVAVHVTSAGGPAIVNVWATWCPPCRRELPLLLDAAERTPDVQVLLVNQAEPAGTVVAYLDRVGLARHGVLLDRRNVVGETLRVAGLPTTLAFDGGGRLVDVHVGELSAAALKRLVERVRP